MFLVAFLIDGCKTILCISFPFVFSSYHISWKVSYLCRSRTAVAPLERLKILLQVGLYSIIFFLPLSKLNTSYLFIYVQTHQQKYQIHDILISSGNMQVQNPHNIKYNGTIQGLKYIWRTEGFRGLFKGNGTNCARIVPNSAVKFFSYEQASK